MSDARGIPPAAPGCTHRHRTHLQTLDNGKPISLYTVSVEMGHADLEMIKKFDGFVVEAGLAF